MATAPNTSITSGNLVRLKIELLANGVTFTPRFLDLYPQKYIEKRWAYGNSDEGAVEGRIPPEVLLNDIVAAVHYAPQSEWNLHFDGDAFFLRKNDINITQISFPLRPMFYDLTLSDGTAAKSVATLYGNGSLGIFVLGTCYYFRVDKQCKFCSLEPTRSMRGDHLLEISPAIAAEASELALLKDPARISQIMINGGNRRNNDLGFLRHIKILESVCSVREKLNRNDVAVHLITMPPDDLELIQLLKDLPIQISMNLEVFSNAHFESITPGKASLYGREKLIKALRTAVNILGVGNVYSIFVGGLEPLATLRDGLSFCADNGIVPIINVFHRDPEGALANQPRPTVDEIYKMGLSLQEIFQRHGFQPFYANCGRNSLDGEAFRGYFT